MNKSDQAFQQACEIVVENQSIKKGIGTLGEKTLHSVLKHYYEPFTENHEVKIGGFVADIVGERGIIEIQTRQFDKLRKKLMAFLQVCLVTVVYPVPQLKWLSWIDMETGEVSPRRKSPKKGTAFDVFFELYKIKDLLNHPNLSIQVVLLELEETRYLNGWSKDKKKGSCRCDRTPICILGEHLFCQPSQYLELLPPALPVQVTTKELQKHAKISLSMAQITLNVLFSLDVVERVGKRGNAYIYQAKKK